MNSTIKKLLPHIIAILVLFILALIFFAPAVFDGKVLNQTDIVQATSSQAEMEKYRSETGKSPLWSGVYFSGMPAYQIHLDTKGNLTSNVFRLLLLGQPLTSPFAECFLAMLCMYLLLSVLRIDWRLSLLGAVVFGISTFNMDIIAAGHSTKMVALAFTPGVLAGTVLAFRGQYIIGGSLFALFTALQMYANHYQITYYTFLIAAVLGISELINAIRNKNFSNFGIGTVALVVGLGLAVLSNLTTIWTTLEYQNESTRGKTELSAAMKQSIETKQGNTPSSNAAGGLSKDYAFGWSYGLGETMTLLVQNAYGGGASQDYSSELAQGLGQMKGFLYMGSQPFVGVGIYFGAIVVFLFVLGLLMVENRWRWSILAAAFLMIAISWGSNFFIGHLLYDVFPMFNKFRAHTQALGLGQMLFAVMAMLALQKFFDPSVTREKKQRALFISAGITAAACLLAWMGGTTGANDSKFIQQYGQQFSQVLPQIKEARAEVIQSDAMRSLFLVLLSAGVLWASLRGIISKNWMTVAVIGVLCFGDVWTASRRVINDEKFQEPTTTKKAQEPAPIDQIIMKDKDLSFRVLDLRQGSPFENATTSMFHKSVGGYHAAKMMIYQEMRERYLENFEKDVPILQQKNMPLYSMLNVKYIILGDDLGSLQPNPGTLGNAWFVKNVKVVDNADGEIEEVGKINPQFDVVIQKKHADKLKGFTPQYDSTATIQLTSYHPDKLEYDASTATDQLAVFSEIYYPMEKGWSMTIDGQPAEFVKANYILRAAKIPAGKHKIVMEFHPKSYYSGETYSSIASSLLLISVLGGLFLYYRKNSISDVNLLPADIEKPTPSVKPTETPQAMTKAKRKK